MIFVQDPVCEQLICWEDAKAIVRHRGSLIYFCSRTCREKFLKSPWKYRNTDDPDAACSRHGAIFTRGEEP